MRNATRRIDSRITDLSYRKGEGCLTGLGECQAGDACGAGWHPAAGCKPACRGAYASLNRRIANPPQVHNLPRIAESRKRYRRFSEGVRWWMMKSATMDQGETPCNSLSPNSRKTYRV